MKRQEHMQFSRIVINGFKSIKKCDLNLNNINVLIGCNGAGKSNFISILELMQYIINGRLTNYAAKKGANYLFYNGPKVTDCIAVEFHFSDYIYTFDLEMTDYYNLLITKESVGHINYLISNGGYKESKLQDWRNDAKTDSIAIHTVLEGHWRTYHFHDTSQNAKVKLAQNVTNAMFLHKDAGNLAAFLYRIKKHYPVDYNNILKSIQTIAPFFKNFVLYPEGENQELIVLRWQKKDCDDVFNAAHLSDGTLRFICLATLLLQPTELQPETIFIDEPELGLHPFSITMFAEMARKAAVNKQIILATQSIELLDNFEIEDIIVVDNTENGSEFKRLDADNLKLWIENDYTLGELWNKNVFGGRP